MVVELKTIEEFANAINNETNKLVVVDFFTQWCGPCKAIAPKFVKLSEKYSDVGFYKIDADNADLAEVTDACMVKSLPTFCFFVDGKYVNSVIGANDQNIEKMILHLTAAKPSDVVENKTEKK